MTSNSAPSTNGTPLAHNQDVSRSHEHINDHATEKWISHHEDALNPDVERGEEDEQHNHHHHSERPQLVSKVTSASGIAGPLTGPELYYSLSRSANQHESSETATASRRPSVASEKTLTRLPSGLADASRVSTDAQGFTYPEGGSQAWLCVFGSFCGLWATLGMMNSIGTVHAYVSRNQLSTSSESVIGWIFGIYAFLSFFLGIQIGPIFDAKGPRWLVLPGSLIVVVTWFLLGVCTQYWHFVMVFGVLGGFSTALLLTPSVAAIGHFFYRRRGLATGAAVTGGAIGGVVYPLLLQSLLPKVGWAWSTRIIGFINIILLIFANLFIRSRLPSKPATRQAILPDPRILRDPIFALTTLGVFFVEWALFIPLTYLTSYAISRGVDEALAYQLIAILNAGSAFGRWAPGLMADVIGRFNTMILTIIICFVSTLALWLPAGGSDAVLIVYALIFGFGSGTGISLAPVCIGQLCKIEEFGRYYSTSYTVISFACLTGIPIAGALIQAADGDYWALIVFTGVSYFASTVVFVVARVMGAGWSLKAVY